MSLTLTYDPQLSRVRISADKLADTVPVRIERSTDHVRWATVRGGESVMPVGGVARLDDYEFAAGVPNSYRLTPTPTGVQVLPMSGQVVTAGGGVAAVLNASGMTIDLTGRMLRLTLTVSDFSKVGNLSFFVATASNLTNNIRFRFNAQTASSQIGKNGEPFQIALQLAEINTAGGSITLSSTGVPSQASGLTAARLHVVDNGTGPVTVTLHKVEVVPAPPGATVSITFDDSHSSITSQAFAKMQALGFRGTDYTIVSSLGQADRSTLADVQARAAAGWEIAGHAYDGAVHEVRLTGVTAAQARADLSALRDWLAERFPDPQGRYSLAYPGGRYEDTTDGAAVEDIAREAGFASGRTILADTAVSTHVQIASPRDPMPYRVHAMSGISSLSAGQFRPSNLIAAGGMLDKVAANGGWLILTFHRIVAGAPTQTSEVSRADFDAIMDAVAARGMTVLPVREVIETVATITPALDRVWLKSIARPFLNRQVAVVDYSDVTRPARSGVFDVVGRSLPVAVSDVRGSRRWTLEVLTETPNAADDLDLLLASGDPLLVHVPAGSGVPGGYVVVGDTSQRRTARRTVRRVFELPCTEVAAPGPDVVGATVTCQGVLNAYPTCTTVLAAHDTCLDLMELIGDPTDVVVP